MTTYSASLGAKVTATSVSARVALPPDSGCNQVLFYNAGTVPVIVAFGDVTVVAVVPAATFSNLGVAIAPGAVMVITRGGATHLGFITESSTAALYLNAGGGE